MTRFRRYFWRSVSVLLVVALVVAPIAWWWITSQPDFRLRRALEAVERDDMKSADRAAVQFEADGYKDYAHFLRGKMHFHDQKIPAALAELNQIDDKGDLRVEAVVVVGRCYMALQDPVQAERAFMFVITQKPDNVEAHKGLASVYFDQGAYMRSIQHAEEWGKLAPRDGRPHRFVGFIYRNLHMHEQALGPYQEALNRDLAAHVVEEVRLELAECQIKRGEFAEALEVLSKSSPPLNQTAANLTMQAECERGLARPAETLAALEKALRADEGYPPALSLRAAMYMDDGNATKAAELLEGVIRVSPYDFAARDRLAGAYTALGKKDKAEAQRQKVKEMQKLFDEEEKLSQQLL